MKIIAMLPVRNEAWVLEHALANLSAFCDVIIVSDQASEDGTPGICRRFPKVVLIGTNSGDEFDRLPRRARWRLLDAARNYDGNNFLWCTDADELVAPAVARAFLRDFAAGRTAPVAVSARYVHLWKSLTRFRDDWSQYGPAWKVVGWLDDRRVDFDRDPAVRPLHEPRTPMDGDDRVINAEHLTVLHLQFALWRRNQLKQAWYRAVEWLDGRTTAEAINGQYAITFSPLFLKTKRLPDSWTEGLTMPAAAEDDRPSWHEKEMLRLFDERGIEFFEPIEIWHVPRLRREFIRRTGRPPRSDRSHIASMPTRLQRFGRRIVRAVSRRAGL